MEITIEKIGYDLVLAVVSAILGALFGALDALKARAEAGDQEAQSQLAEHKQYQVRATVKSYRKMRDDALNGDPIAKERYEKTLAKRREAHHAKKNEQSA